MRERLPTCFRNTRKHFVKCVDCGCQALPQNASRERPWSAAASLHILSRVNDGALCFTCANKRKALLGFPVGQDNGAPKNESEPSVAGAEKEPRLKTIRINQQEYRWNVSTFESLINNWKDLCLYGEHKDVDSRWWRVVVNGEVISADQFDRVAVSDGDKISIILGRGRYR